MSAQLPWGSDRWPEIQVTRGRRKIFLDSGTAHESPEADWRVEGYESYLAGELIRFGDRVAMGNSRGKMSRMISRLMVEGWYHSGSQETLEIKSCLFCFCLCLGDWDMGKIMSGFWSCLIGSALRYLTGAGGYVAEEGSELTVGNCESCENQW